MTAAPVATLLVVFALHFCSPDLNAFAPSEGISVAQNIAYASGKRRTLDVYAARHGTAPAPVAVFFYGGGWENGTKDMYRFVGTALASHGIVVVIPDYRLHPEVQFPAFVDDAAQAVAWVYTNVSRFGGDPHRVFLMGHSAGGQIAALLALDPEYLGAVGLSPKRDVCGVIGLAGAYDFDPTTPDEFAAIFGPASEWPRSRPINFVTASAPPMLLLTGSIDNTVEPGNTYRLTERLRAVGAVVTDKEYPGISHTALIAAFARPFMFLAPVVDDTADFIASHLDCAK